MLQSLENAIHSIAQKQQNIAFNIHLTGKCDMKCIGCYARFGEDITPKPFSLSKTDWEKVINTIHDLSIGLNAKINFVGGEVPFHLVFQFQEVQIYLDNFYRYLKTLKMISKSIYPYLLLFREFNLEVQRFID